MSASPSKRQKLNKENESNINTQCECCQAFECLKSVKSGGDSTKPPVHDAYSNNPLATTSLTPEKLTKTYEVATKRTNAISWDDYFMSIAHLSALRSKDPSTQVGACIVNEEQRIVGIGYNGFPAGCDDDKLPWSREAASDLDTKYPFVCHAEMNAILNKNGADSRGCRIYVKLFPCNECAKLIIQSGINEVVYLSDKYHQTDSCVASRKMFDMSGVAYRRHEPKLTSITIDLSIPESEKGPDTNQQ